MSLHGYGEAIRLRREDVPIYALIMAAMMKADGTNLPKLVEAWPDVWEELQVRYNSPGGLTADEHATRCNESTAQRLDTE